MKANELLYKQAAASEPPSPVVVDDGGDRLLNFQIIMTSETTTTTTAPVESALAETEQQCHISCVQYWGLCCGVVGSQSTAPQHWSMTIQ